MIFIHTFIKEDISWIYPPGSPVIGIFSGLFVDLVASLNAHNYSVSLNAEVMLLVIKEYLCTYDKIQIVFEQLDLNSERF